MLTSQSDSWEGKKRNTYAAYRFYITTKLSEYILHFDNRHWLFKCAEGTQEIEVPKFAPGVLGLNPIILPGECFQYMSMVHLATPEGSMEGSFLLENKANNEPLEVKIGLCKMSSMVAPVT